MKHIRIFDQDSLLCGKNVDMEKSENIVIPELIKGEYVLDNKVAYSICASCFDEFKDDFIDGHFENLL